MLAATWGGRRGHAGDMRVVVTGGAGFIGTAVVAALSGAGHEVTVVDHVSPRTRADGTPTRAAGSVIADVRDADAVRGVLRAARADQVVHLAAKVGLGTGIDDITDYVSANDLGTAVVLGEAARSGVGHVVLASSMVVYGEGAYDCMEHGRVRPGPRRVADLDAGQFEPRCPACGAALSPALVTEDAPADPRNVYAATKVHGEHLLGAWARETQAGGTALRFHNVYGPGMPRDTPYAGVASLFASELAAGRPPRVHEDGGQRRDLVHVDDVADSVVAAVERPAAPAEVEVFNVGSGHVTTVGELARALSEVMDGPAPVVTGAYRLGDVRHVTASSDRIRQRLGWQARTSLPDGLAALVRG